MRTDSFSILSMYFVFAVDSLKSFWYSIAREICWSTTSDYAFYAILKCTVLSTTSSWWYSNKFPVLWYIKNSKTGWGHDKCADPARPLRNVWCKELRSCKYCSTDLEVQLFEGCQQHNQWDLRALACLLSEKSFIFNRSLPVLTGYRHHYMKVIMM